MIITLEPKKDTYTAFSEPEDFTVENIQIARELLEAAINGLFAENNRVDSGFHIFTNKQIPYESDTKTDGTYESTPSSTEIQHSTHPTRD